MIDESFPANLASYQPGPMLYSCTKLIGEAPVLPGDGSPLAPV